MEREHSDHIYESHSDFLPDGWMLVNRHDSPKGIFLWMARVDANPDRNWVTVFGSTYEEALQAGWIRARLYDEITRFKEA